MRVVRVALHRPVERTVASVKAKRAGEAGEIRCEIRFAPKQVWTLWGRAANQLHGKRATGAANSHLAGLLMFS